jgi:death-on-curing protein
VNYLTSAQVLFIHSRLISETGGSHGVRDLGLLESAVARPQATFDGSDLYTDVFAKAAALMESLVKNHPFVDGNKRTGLAAVAVFLRRNGCNLTASTTDVEAVTLRVAAEGLSLDQLAAWLRSASTES